MKLIRSFLIVAILVAAGCSASNDNEVLSTNDKIVNEFLGTAPGGLDVLHKRAGAIDRSIAGVGSNEGESLVSGRPFRVGSISKTFVAVMVLQLVDENVVSLDASLASYLPNTLIGGTASIRQLLSHRTGIPNYSDQPTFFSTVTADLSRPYTPDEILSFVVDVPLGQAGEFSYSNTNYILLGQLIEQLDGVDLNAALQARITGPLELYNTVFDDGTSNVVLPDGMVSGWSDSFDFDGDPMVPYQAIASSAWAAGSLISTADNLASFLNALVLGQLMSADAFAQMSDTGESDYGLGLQLLNFSSGRAVLGHGGSIPGYLSGMVVDPADGTTLIVLTNNDALNIGSLATQIIDAE